ncbi:MAG: MlaD family protein [bacterium]|nr:MlaD family protein [bacterium]
MTEKNREKNIHLIHSIELLVWLIIILIFVAIFSVGKFTKEFHNRYDYKVFLPDVDGLVVGSPVRMMGIEVGHVVKIKPIKDEVYVKFILTNPNVHVPKGTKITVEFSGIAGSKSIELYPPDKNTYIDDSSSVFDVQPPKRLHDALGLLDTMYKKISTIIYSVSNFGSRVSEIDKSIPTNNNAQSFQEFVDYSDKYIDISTTRANNISKKIKGSKYGK